MQWEEEKVTIAKLCCKPSRSAGALSFKGPEQAKRIIVVLQLQTHNSIPTLHWQNECRSWLRTSFLLVHFEDVICDFQQGRISYCDRISKVILWNCSWYHQIKNFWIIRIHALVCVLMRTDDLQGARISSETYSSITPVGNGSQTCTSILDTSSSSDSYWKIVYPCNAYSLHWNIFSSAAPVWCIPCLIIWTCLILTVTDTKHR